MTVRELELELARQRALARRHVPEREHVARPAASRPTVPRTPSKVSNIADARRSGSAKRGSRIGRGGRAHGRSDQRMSGYVEQPRRNERLNAMNAATAVKRPKAVKPPRPAKLPKAAIAPRDRPLQRVEKTRRRRKARTLTSPSGRPRLPIPGVFRAGTPRTRLLAFLIAAVVIFGGILFRITMLQTTDAQSYTLAGTHQRTQATTLRASRGVIFDRNGDELALSVPATTVFVNPKLVLDPVGTASVLGATLQLTPAKEQALATAMADKSKGFVYVARQVDEATAHTVMSLKLAGVDSFPENTRVVPGGDLARGLIGRTDTDGTGIAGLELQYSALLTGTDGELVQEHDTKGNAIPGSSTVSVAAVPGHDLVLTIDRSIQFSLEQALLLRVSTLGAKGGTAVVMQSATGDVLAMASVERSPDGTYHVSSANLGAVACEEPGSVAKVITTSGALNAGLIAPDTSFQVPGYKIYNKGTKWRQVIRDAEPHNTVAMSTKDILVQSSNIGTIGESELLGPERQYDYMTSFGLGQKSALDFPSETAGQLKPWQQWQGTEKVTKAYGYGVCATAIQLTSAVNVIANNGVYVAPRLVQGTIGNDGQVVPAGPSATHQVVTPQTAQEMNLLMRAVVCEGTGEAAKVPGLTIAGKTGTGIKAVNGVYGTQGVDAKYYASFVGFFPAEAPQVTTLISIDEPPAAAGDLTHFGGTAAAPVFQAFVPTVMHQLGIQPPNPNGGCPAK